MPIATLEQAKSSEDRSVNDWASHDSIHHSISFDELWAGLQLGQEAVAVFDSNHQIMRSNAGFQTLFPTACTFSDMTGTDDVPCQDFRTTRRRESEILEIRCQLMPQAGLSVASVSTQPMAKDQLHSYLQARDRMFTVSRTVSVSEMAMTLAHEINTPIGTISNLLHVVQRKLGRIDGVPEDVSQALTACSEQTAFTSEVIERIRNFTQARQPVRESISIQSLVSEAINLLDWHFLMNECQIRNQLPAEAILVEGDRVMLQQVILNLLKNAADAMSEVTQNRFVDIAVEVKASRVRIKIRDYGEGLGSSGSSLFVPFVSEKPTGMGIGLNICRSFLELHAGRMWLSNAEGQGCVATVELPYEIDLQQQKGMTP